MGARVAAAPLRLEIHAPTVDCSLPGAAGRLMADSRHALLRVDGVATFAIEDGRRVRFEPDPDAEPGRISMWLNGTVAALILAQRGRFALHASVVEIGGRAVAVTGPRQVGKSTTVLRLAQRGHSLVTDDVSPVHQAGRMTVQPFDRPIHVFPETADGLGLDISESRRLFAEHQKLTLPAPRSEAVPLEAIAVLSAEPGAEVRSVRVVGARAHWLVTENIYRVELFRELWQADMFSWAATLATRLPISAVTRPTEGWSVDAVADAIEAVIGTEPDRRSMCIRPRQMKTQRS